MRKDIVDILVNICDKTKTISTVVGGAPNHGTDFLRKAINGISERDNFCHLIGVDGGAEILLHLGLEPDYFVGDCDSFVGAGKSVFFASAEKENVLIFPSEKDDTDMQLAIETAAKNGAEQVVMLAATNGRLDHFLGCFQLMEHFGELKSNSVRLIIADEQNVLFYVGEEANEVEFEMNQGFYFSIIPVSSCVSGLSISGAKYPLDEFDLKRGPSRSISNCLPYGRDCGKVKLSKSKGSFVVVVSKDR